jgi:hypothetical protein
VSFKLGNKTDSADLNALRYGFIKKKTIVTFANGSAAAVNMAMTIKIVCSKFKTLWDPKKIRNTVTMEPTMAIATQEESKLGTEMPGKQHDESFDHYLAYTKFQSALSSKCEII